MKIETFGVVGWGLMGMSIAQRTLYFSEIVYKEFLEPRLSPPPLLKRMVPASYLGRKIGQ